MRDIEIAKNLLVKEDYTLVVVKSGETIFTSKEKGIKPMFKLAKEMEELSKNASIADKVIGRGAALISTYLNIYEVYGEVISKGAIELLKKENINFTCDITCDYIENRDKTGLCPIETISLGISDPNLFLFKVEEFLK